MSNCIQASQRLFRAIAKEVQTCLPTANSQDMVSTELMVWILRIVVRGSQLLLQSNCLVFWLVKVTDGACDPCFSDESRKQQT